MVAVVIEEGEVVVVLVMGESCLDSPPSPPAAVFVHEKASSKVRSVVEPPLEVVVGLFTGEVEFRG